MTFKNSFVEKSGKKKFGRKKFSDALHWDEEGRLADMDERMMEYNLMTNNLMTSMACGRKCNHLEPYDPLRVDLAIANILQFSWWGLATDWSIRLPVFFEMNSP
eukprot:1316825-Pyramimonas_sp.AAC.1